MSNSTPKTIFAAKKSTFLILLTLLGFTFLFSQAVIAQGTFVSKATGNWSSPSTWTLTTGTDADGIPDANDNVTVQYGHKVTLSQNASAKTVTIGGGFIGSTAQVDVKTYTFTVSGDLLLDPTNVRHSNLTINTGTVNIGGVFSKGSGTASVGLIFTGAGTINMTGNSSWALDASVIFNGTGSNVNFTGTNQSIATASAFDNLIIKSGSTTTATALFEATNFTIENNGKYIHNASTIPSTSNSFPGTNHYFADNSTVEIASWTSPTATNIAPLPAGITWGNLIINVPTLGSSWNQQGNITNVKGDLEIVATGGSDRTFILSGSTTNVSTVIKGDLIVSGGNMVLSKINSANVQAGLSVDGNVLINGGNFGIVEGNMNNPQPVSLTIGGSLIITNGNFYGSGASYGSTTAYNANWTLTTTGNILVNGGNFIWATGTAPGSTRNWSINAGGDLMVSSGNFGVPPIALGEINFTGGATTATISFANPFTATNISLIIDGKTVALASPITVASLMITANSSLIINSGIGLFVTGTANFNGQPVTIRSDNSGTGFIGNSPGTISGATNVTVERYIPQNASRAWRLLSFPTKGQTIHESWQENQPAGIVGSPGLGTNITSRRSDWQARGFDFGTPGNSALFYDAANDTLIGIPTTNGVTATTSGYFLYIRGDRSVTPSISTTAQNATTLRSTGTLYTGTQAPVAISAGQSALIGNIYPSSIDLRNLVIGGGTESNFDIWDPKLAGENGLGGYQTLTKNGSDYIISPGGGSYGAAGSINNIIQSGMAFFATATGSAGSVTFTEAAKSTSNTSTVFSAPTATKSFISSLYVVSGTGNALIDGTMQLLNEDFSNEVDAIDAKKRYNFGENLYIARSGKMLSVEKRRLFGNNDTIYFGITNLRAKTYQFVFSAVDMASSNLYAVLEDAYTKQSTPIDLSTTNTISFNIDNNAASKAVDRFRIVFKVNGVLAVSFADVKAYAQKDLTMVEWNVQNQEDIRSYLVEKSTNGTDFVTTGTVAANSATAASYQWIDKTPVEGNNYYRVISIQNNGTKNFSRVVKVSFNGKSGISLYNNPVTNGNMRLIFTGVKKGTYGARLLNTNGAVLTVKQINHDGNNNNVSLTMPNSLPTGNYLLEIISPDKTSSIQNVLISR